MMRRAWLTVAVAAALAGIPSAEGPRPRDPLLVALVSETGAAPPEFAADVLTRLATSDRIADPEWKRELLELAFDRAAIAHEPFRRSAGAVPPDSRTAALLQAYDIRLDRVSLQARVAVGMLPVDAERAHEMFDWIDPHFGPTSCDDLLVANADEYYGALTRLALGASRLSAYGRANAISYLGFYLGRARLPSEMPALVRSVRAVKPSAMELAYLDGVLRFALDHAVKDVRGFETTSLELLDHVGRLADEESQAHFSPSALVYVVRRYLVEQLKSARCADSVAEAPIVATFNALRSRPSVDHPPDAITAKDMAIVGVSGAARIQPYWRSVDARRLHDDLIELRGSDRQPVPESVRRTIEWERKADAFLGDVDRWADGSGETAADYFYQKSVLLALLLDAAPQAPLRDRAARLLVEHLRHSLVMQDRPALWFLPVARLLQDARPEARRDLVSAMERSGHPVLALYAHAERRMPPPRRDQQPRAPVRRP